MKMNWYIASKNPGKLVEFQYAIKAYAPKGLAVNSSSFVDLGLDFEIEVEENGNNYGQNAAKKAFEILELYFEKFPNSNFLPTILSDDSGIEVEALFGRPGLFSARWAGKNGNDNAPVTKLIKELSEVPDYERDARYLCSLGILVPGHSKRVGEIDSYTDIQSTGVWNTTIKGRKYTFLLTMATISGKIAKDPKGCNGFAYDSYFVDQNGNHLAEYSNHAKSIISHRGKALHNLFNRLREVREID